jgi:hypothetical protein
MRTLTEAKVLLETLKAITSDFLMAKFVEVSAIKKRSRWSPKQK